MKKNWNLQDVDRQGKSTHATYYEIDKRGVPFYLQDGVGNVCVYPDGIESDLRLQFRGQAKEEKTLLISWRSETGIEAEVRQRAQLSTFGGGGLGIVSGALFLHEFGIF